MHPVELLNTMKTLLDFNETDIARLKTIGPLLTASSAEMAECLYASLEKIEECRQIITAYPDRRAKLQGTLIGWYAGIFSGVYDEAYAAQRWIIGLVYVKVWIPPQYVVGAIETVYAFSAKKLKAQESALGGDSQPYIESLAKMLSIDLAFIEQSYAQSMNKALSQELGTNEALLHRVVESGVNTLLKEMRQE